MKRSVYEEMSGPSCLGMLFMLESSGRCDQKESLGQMVLSLECQRKEFGLN